MEFFHILITQRRFFLDKTLLKSSLIGLSILFVWGFMLPFALGLFYHMILNYPFNEAHLALLTLTPSTLLRIYLFGILIVGWLSALILTGRIDTLLLSAGYLPVFENLVFAVITVWNSIQSSGPNITSQKLQNDLITLKVLIIRPFIRDLCYSLLLTYFLIFCQYYAGVAVVVTARNQHDMVSYLLRTWSLGHLFIYFAIMTVIVQTLSSPIKQWGKWYYSKIKDENYLIGMELQNSAEVGFHQLTPTLHPMHTHI